ncbi:30S ribosomal protein S6 [Candidatus Comchoanobacter bicostacola]|uniref:Multifunctional fusion protein n=1 Tax=Candidatus Comchoanobacter bicostacola TaxID=2919598 RepID=A0ABY5DMS1_9GAMM|nr:30S ribosomal protein S6 [Candidatus Comchoanobacter bicostacola]UTC24814.1 30S ribosomal protein S6 [Candidatus Comchoanobacter bicostacola]
MVDKKVYEMVLIIDPAQSEQADEILSRYSQLVDEHAGKLIRAENWGRKKLAYAIKRQFKGHYLYLNFQSSHALIELIRNNYLKHNDAVLRHWIAGVDSPVAVQSPLYVESENDKEARVPDDHPERVNWKNVRLLRDSIMETCRILPRRTTGLSSKEQRVLTRSIKVARFLALIPYCDRHKHSI